MGETDNIGLSNDIAVTSLSSVASTMEALKDAVSGELSDKLSAIGNAAAQSIKFDSPDVLDRFAYDYTIPDLGPDLSDLSVGGEMDWKQLIILGNGFDLQCGLHSKFGDFFGPRLALIEGIPDCRRETWAALAGSDDLTLWDFILTSRKGSSWCDIEKAIEEWVLSAKSPDVVSSPFHRALKSIKSCPFGENARLLDSGNRARSRNGSSVVFDNVARYVWSLRPEIADEGCSRDRLMLLMKEELAKLELAFAQYLSKEVASNEEYAKECHAFYKRIESDGKKSGEGYYSSTSVLNFNYTDEVARCFDGGEEGVCVNIHGTLGGEIIFGIDGKDCMDNADALPFTKTFRLMRRGGSRTDKLISTANGSNLQDATDVIKFYGHSLGRADYSYFQAIFDGVDLYESKTVLVFYYRHDESVGEEANVEERAKCAIRINDLLVAYGSTLDNADHGKNLMHKLLLEGRLIIKDVPTA